MPGDRGSLGGTEQPGSSCSECSKCAHCANRRELSPSRSRAGVRVSINLEQFFADHRARVFMWAPYGRCVQWLGRRVTRLFGLPGDIALTCRGHTLPAAEPLLMLDSDDPIEVIKTSNSITISDNAGDASVEAAARAHVPCLTAFGADDEERLRLLKRRALRLLDERCAQHAAEGPASEPPVAKRVRRRRRRRAPALRPGSAASDEEPPGASEPGVLRGGSGARPPRLVRALSQSADNGVAP